MQSARAGFARREKSYHKKMQGYPHFFLFSFFLFHRIVPRTKPSERGAQSERERDDEQGGGEGEKKSLVIVR